MEKEYGFHGYDQKLGYLLQRINPEKHGFDERQKVKNVRIGPLNLTPNNKVVLERYYLDLVNEGLTKPRILSLLDQTSRILEWLNKDYDKVMEEDIKGIVSRVRNADISEYTKSDYLTKLKRFDKWFHGGEDYSPLTRRIRTTVKMKDMKLPSELISPEEAEQLINATDTSRDRALIHLLWESGARVGEAANLKIKDLEFKKGECRAILTGKTGSRRVLLLECVRDIQNYVKVRNAKSPEDYLFVLEGNRNKGKQITYGGVARVIDDIKEKINMKKRLHPHLFRHSRATYLASKGLSEAQLCMIFGWIIGSKQVRTYIHLSGAQVESAYKKIYGMQKQEETEPQLIRCQVCGEFNPPKNDSCQNCYNPLTIQGALKIKQENELLQHDRNISQKVFAEAFRLVSEQKISIDEAQKQAIKIIAQQTLQQTRSVPA
ncbi:MAG: tyrosine-type recombinase/integrase, partial [Candidatus Diapherotrites archaeon]|nr:tyrosine-type recombinase/integrase [Candidatus Diapherotrites archaeon]